MVCLTMLIFSVQRVPASRGREKEEIESEGRETRGKGREGGGGGGKRENILAAEGGRKKSTLV